MKTCPYCAEAIQDAAVKCRFCGSALTDERCSPTEELLPEATGGVRPIEDTTSATPGLARASTMPRVALPLLGVLVAVGIGAAVFIWKPWTPTYVQLANRLLDAYRTGAITSVDQVTWKLRGMTEGTLQEYGISVWVADDAIEFLEPSIAGKIVSFTLEQDTQEEWRLPRMVAKEETEIKMGKWGVEMDLQALKEKRPLALGEKRSFDGGDETVRDADGTPQKTYVYDRVVGARRLQYKVETDRGFYKAAVVVDDKSIYLVDFHR